MEVSHYTADENRDEVIEFIKKNNMPWQHVYNPKERDKGIVGNFNIGFFPTFMLIDPAGKIIARESGKDKLPLIEEALLESMKQK